MEDSNSEDSNHSSSVPLKISLNLPANVSAKPKCKSPNPSDPQEDRQYITEFDLNNSTGPRKIIPKLQNSWRLFTQKSEPEVQTTGFEPSSNGTANSEHEGLKESETEKLRKQIQQCATEPSPHEYENMPVEEFGEALLRGMGWSYGKGVGLNAIGPVAPFQAPRRVGRLGLGAQKP